MTFSRCGHSHHSLAGGVTAIAAIPAQRLATGGVSESWHDLNKCTTPLQNDEDGPELGPELRDDEPGELEELGEFLSDRALQNLTGSEDLNAVTFLEVPPNILSALVRGYAMQRRGSLQQCLLCARKGAGLRSCWVRWTARRGQRKPRWAAEGNAAAACAPATVQVRIDTDDIVLRDLGARLPRLTELKMNSSNVRSFRDLGTSFGNLTVLWLARSNVLELDGVGSLTHIKELYLAFNEVADLSPLAGCEELEALDLEGNQVAAPADAHFLAACARHSPRSPSMATPPRSTPGTAATSSRRSRSSPCSTTSSARPTTAPLRGRARGRHRARAAGRRGARGRAL